MDILLPLAATSNNNFLELKLALRSIATCSDVDNIYVITTADIPWIQNVKLVRIDDPYTNNKDKNLIRKVQLTLQMYPEITDFVIWMDDFIAARPMSLRCIPDVYNNRSLASFSNDNLSKWQRRLKFTLSVFQLSGKDVSCNWDSHVPMRFNSAKVLSGLEDIDCYSGGANYTLYTLLANLCDKDRQKAVSQDLVKCTCESSEFNLNWDKLFIGYNDKAFNNGLSDRLLEKFPNKSRYEKELIQPNSLVNIFVANLTDAESFKRMLTAYTRHTMIFSWDTVSDCELSKLDVSYIASNELSTQSKLLFANMLSKYSILYDGVYEYPVNYLETSLNEDADTSAIIYEPDKHRGIVNNYFLLKTGITCTDSNLFNLIDTLTVTVKPSIIIRENEV